VDSPDHEPFAGSFSFAGALSPDPSHNATQNVRLYRIKRITAGESTVVTIAPGDPFCGVFNDELTCRTVRVMVPASGLLVMSCDPRGDDNGGPGLNIEGYNTRIVSGDWHVTAGTEVPVRIGMWQNWPVSQSCVFTTSIARP
jgi:hypothetical protein